MTYFIKDGNSYTPVKEAALDLHTNLPAGNYIIKQTPTGSLYLERIDSFEVTGKIYGSTIDDTDKIFNTFIDRENSTGVLLVGEKGSGKTLLAKSLSIKCAKENMPTIVINAPWTGDAFNKLIQDIEQPCMVLFDEFEKVYRDNEYSPQEGMLTLLDGVYPSKKLFVLTCNDKWRIDSHMRNRPGRIYYMLEFDGLHENFVREYCTDNVKKKKYVDEIVRVSKIFSKFNFDMLKALVEEVNRYDQAPAEALKMLNVKPEFDDYETRYNVSIKINGKDVEKRYLHPTEFQCNPTAFENFIVRVSPSGEESYEDYDCDPYEPTSVASNYPETKSQIKNTSKILKFEAIDLKKFDHKTDTFVYSNKEGVELHLTKMSLYQINPFAF